jgi:hypothetical protein
MDPGEILNRGRSSAREGRHEEALRDFIWFHEHALEHDRSYYGVRLSFALGNWMDLAADYPPALEALRSVKRRGEAELLRGKGNRYLFHDVESINRELKRTKDTYKLFLAIKKKHPKLAKACADLAIEEIVEAEDFKLASEYLPHPENYLLWLSDQLNERLEQKNVPRRIAIRRCEAYVRNYCRDVRTALRILNGLRNRYAAKAALEWAIALVRPKQARDMVCTQLTSKPRRIH